MSATFEKAPHPRSNYAAVIDFSMFLIECQYIAWDKCQEQNNVSWCGKTRVRQEPISGSDQLTYWASVTAFSRTVYFYIHFGALFPHENESSVSPVSVFEV